MTWILAIRNGCQRLSPAHVAWQHAAAYLAQGPDKAAVMRHTRLCAEALRLKGRLEARLSVRALRGAEGPKQAKPQKQQQQRTHWEAFSEHCAAIDARAARVVAPGEVRVSQLLVVHVNYF